METYSFLSADVKLPEGLACLSASGGTNLEHTPPGTSPQYRIQGFRGLLIGLKLYQETPVPRTPDVNFSQLGSAAVFRAQKLEKVHLEFLQLPGVQPPERHRCT